MDLHGCMTKDDGTESFVVGVSSEFHQFTKRFSRAGGASI
jgi:hypothetical protein